MDAYNIHFQVTATLPRLIGTSRRGHGQCQHARNRQTANGHTRRMRNECAFPAALNVRDWRVTQATNWAAWQLSGAAFQASGRKQAAQAPDRSSAASPARPAAILLSRSSFVCFAASACSRIADAFAPCSIAAIFGVTRCGIRTPSLSTPNGAAAAGAGATLAGAAGAG